MTNLLLTCSIILIAFAISKQSKALFIKVILFATYRSKFITLDKTDQLRLKVFILLSTQPQHRSVNTKKTVIRNDLSLSKRDLVTCEVADITESLRPVAASHVTDLRAGTKPTLIPGHSGVASIRQSCFAEFFPAS